MTRKETTQNLSKRLENYFSSIKQYSPYVAKEVTFDFHSNHSVRVDYMRFQPKNSSVSGIEKGDFFCFEIKSSVKDFHSPNGHNFLGDYNYYVMPEEVYEKIGEEIPFNIGVLIPKDYEDFQTLTSIKSAKRMDRQKSVSEMLLMMFRSCVRDVQKEIE